MDWFSFLVDFPYEAKLYVQSFQLFAKILNVFSADISFGPAVNENLSNFQRIVFARCLVAYCESDSPIDL